MLTLEQLVKNNFNKIKTVVKGRAFKYNIDSEELQSIVNYKLSIAISRNLFNTEIETMFWSYIHTIVTNAANDVKRNIEPYCEEIESYRDIFSSYQPDIDLKRLNNVILTTFYERLSKNEKLVFRAYFLGGVKYEEASGETGISLGQIKSVIFRIRAKANQYYGERYKLLIA